MQPVVLSEALSKFYGRQRGIVDVDLEVAPGEVFGYLGPNGAGKTTTIRLLLDLIRPSGGRVEVLGLDPRRDGCRLRRRVGYIPGEMTLYERMTGREMVTYLAHLRQMSDLGPAIELAERFDLDLTRPIRDLSRGNKQKLGIVQAFMHRPELLILDEPTSGLDPLMQREFYRLAGETSAAGHSIFLSSHVLGEVERIADRIGIIREGRMVIVEGLEQLKAKALRRYEIRFAGPVPDGAFEAVPNVRDVVVEGTVLTCTAEGTVTELMRIAAPFEITNVVSHEADLEELFLRYYEGATDAR